MRLLLLLAAVALIACGDASHGPHGDCFGPRDDAGFCVVPDGWEHLSCNPLTQAGCNPPDKCTWIIDATAPQYVGHIGCVPDGTVAEGSACTYGAAGSAGYDDCSKGTVCSAFNGTGTPGICKQVCDNSGGNPMCDATHVCITEEPLFSTGASSPAAAGVCEAACNPLDDNDFDGSGSALSRVGSACGSASIGCYGLPNGGTPPAATFACLPDIHYTTPLHHRTECTAANGCAEADGTIDVNSCNQGYEPLLNESTGNSTVVCIALCKPLDCYAGHCGSNDENRLGAAPHRCANPDAAGSFGSGEECEYLWREELDGNRMWLRSPFSDSVGFCFDHSRYEYDPTLGTNPTIPYPPCEQLQLHATGSDPNDPLTYFGADDFGCVSSTTAGITPAQRRPLRALPRRWR